MKTQEQKLFDLVDDMGEMLSGDLHIIDNTERFPEAMGEREYRVYHSGGYCFDVFKKANEINEDTGDVIEWYYDFFTEWEGFKKIKSAGEAMKLIKQTA